MKKLIIKMCAAISTLVILALPLPASALDRVAVTLSNGDLYIKEGPINSAWHQETSGMTIGNYSLASNRISLVDAGGANKEVAVKEPGWNSPWNWVAWNGPPYNTRAYTSLLSDGNYRLVIQRDDDSLVMKDGPWNAGWWSGTVTLPAGNLSSVVIGGDRLGVIMDTGNFYVKQLTPGQFSHPNNTPWTLETTSVGVDKAAMTNNRIAYIDSSNKVFIKEGGINDSWFQGGPGYIFDNATKVRLSGNRVCILRTFNDVFCKDGTLSAPVSQVWTVFNDTATDVQLAASNSNRVAIVTSNSNAFVLDGSIYGANSGWQEISTGNVSNLGMN